MASTNACEDPDCGGRRFYTLDEARHVCRPRTGFGAVACALLGGLVIAEVVLGERRARLVRAAERDRAGSS